MKKRRCWILLAIINIFLIILYGVIIFSWKQGDVWASYNPELELNGDERRIVYSTPAMRRGVYTVSVEYEVDNNAYKLSCLATTAGRSYPVIYADEYQLSSQQNNLTFRLWVNSDIDYFLVRLESTTPTEDISIDNIYIAREFKESLMYLTLRLCVWLLIVDIIAIVIAYRAEICRRIEDNIYVVLGLLIIFGICSFSVISNYQVWGHDVGFHWSRIVGIAEGLTSGSFPVRIQPGWCNDYGYAASVFYGDILLYIPALLYVACVPLVYTYKFYLLCINVGTIGIAYFCYKRLSRDKYIAVACTALYCVSINRILNVFVRMAVGEYSAYMFLPLVLLGMKEILCTETKEHSQKHSWMFLCIGMTGLIQTHILSVEMTCIMLGSVVIALNRRLLHWEIISAFLKSIAATIFINLGFLVPFLDYSRQELAVFFDKDDCIQGFGLSLYELFSIGTVGSGNAKMSTTGLVKRIPVSLGLGIIIIIVFVLIVLARTAWDEYERKRMLFVLGIAGLGLFMSTYYFPWNRLANIPYIQNMVSSIQVPWRFISITMPILVYAACLLFMKIKESVSREKVKHILVGICLITALQGMYCTDLSLRAEKNYVIYDGHNILREVDSMMMGEYLFAQTDKEMTLTDQDISGQNVSVSNTQRNGNKVIVSCEAKQDAYIEVPLFAYDYYKCIDMETKETFVIKHGENHKIHIDLPSGYRGDLMVYFAEPWFWRMAETISLLAFVGLTIHLIHIYRPNKK